MTKISSYDYQATPEQIDDLLAKLSLQTGFIYLDSADDSSWSYCAWQPVISIETYGVRTLVTQMGSTTVNSEDDPFSIMQTALNAVWPEGDSERLNETGFCGGLLGYWGYELGGRIETLPSPKAHDIDAPDMNVGIYDFALSISKSTGQLILKGQEPRLDEVFESLLNLVEGEKQSPTQAFQLKSAWSANMTQAEYATKFSRVKDYLSTGDCYQINLAQRFSAAYQGEEWLAYQALRASNKAPFSSFIRTKTSAILSLSPERFLQVKNGRIETKPIKGTRPRHNDPEQDLAAADELKHADKDRAENLMIVDLLRNDVSKVAIPGSVDVPKLFDIESYPAVHHLVSTVTATLKPGYNAIDLLRGAFPGGSITGAPKIRAMEIINELEPHPRSVYCGAIGYILPNGDMDTNITIRTLVCNKGKIYCWAGGGLVADSNLASEYQETLDKVNKILPVLTAL